MRPSRFAARRIRPSKASLNHHNGLSNALPPRHFSQNSQLLLIFSSPIPRPQLPFLYPSSSRVRTPHYQISRLITTERRKFIKETAKLSVKFGVTFWLISTLASIAGIGILSERQEREFPSPHEWSTVTRFRFRRGRWWEIPENNDNGVTNWAPLYNEYEQALKRLEDPTKDGAGLSDQEEGGILVPGVGKAGFDLTAKSEEWRQGYWEVLMGMAKAAEHSDGWVIDKTQTNAVMRLLGLKGTAWPPEYIATAENPRPKAPLPGAPEPPEEENCIPVAHPPEKFYLKILTSNGFTTHQRIAAALGYADWLSFKNLTDSAEEMYRWALDIAISGLPNPTTTTSTINSTTAIISASAPPETITPNLVHTATTLATHYASLGNISLALPIFLSTLRARRSAPPAPPAPEPTKREDTGLLATVTDLLAEPSYPALPPTGDEPLLRREEDRCEEAVLMNYIGEILFASAGQKDSAHRQKALNWTREAVKTASDACTLSAIQARKDIKKKCEKCEEVGLENWGKMIMLLAAEAREKQEKGSQGWFSSGEKSIEEVKSLEAEETDVATRLAALRDRMLRDYWDEQDKAHARFFVV